MQTNSDENNDLLLDDVIGLGRRLRELEGIDTARAYAQVSSTIRANALRSLRTQLVRAAACLALPLLISTVVLGFLLLRQPAAPTTYAEIVAMRGAVLRYELPDSTVVWLNSGSRLRFPTQFRGDKRCVELCGEGYFVVAKDAQKPFHVSTSAGLDVVVRGTKFNVSAYDDCDLVEITLESGSVDVLPPHDGQAQTMRRGEMISYDKRTRTLTRSNVEASVKTAWRDGKMVFRGATIEEIFARLERHFNVEIKLRNPQNRQYRYRATFEKETIYQILDCLSRSTDMTWKQEYDDNKTKTTIYVTLH